MKPDAPAAFHFEQVNLEVPIQAMPHTGHAALMYEFVDAVRSGKKPETDCTDNIQSLAMVLAAVESAKTGKKVAVKW